MEQKQSHNSVYYWIGGIVLVVLIGGFIYFTRSSNVEPVVDSTPTDTSIPSTLTSPYGLITLKLGETANFRGISITPLRIEEDSRCAQGVQCVWAGIVKVSVRSDLASGESVENMITLGQTTKIDTFAVALTVVTPEAVSGTKITPADYRLTFDVHQSTVVDNELIGK